MSDSDSDVPVKKPVKKTVKAVVASDSDDDTPVVKKPVAKKAKKPVDSDSDDDTPVVKKPVSKKAAAHKDQSESDEDAPVVKKPTAKKAVLDSDSDSDAPVKGRVFRDPGAGLDDDSDDDSADDAADLIDLIDYDSMPEDAFIAHLKSQSKAKRLEEKRRVSERKAATSSSSHEDCHFDGTPAYSYNFMLGRVLDICRQNNPELAQAERIRLPMPKIEKSGSKKTALTNFKDICKHVNRTQDEVKDYIEKTLTCTGAIDGNYCLILKYQGAKLSTFEKLFSKYVEEFVQCKACGRIQTTLTKDASSRLLLMNCKDCKASRYIQVATGASFKAQTTKRSKLRNAAAMT